MSKSVVIYGFGRMGMTHYAILNQLMDNVDFTFVDINKRLNLIVKKNINARIVRDDTHLKERFDYSLICTPPMFHVSVTERCIKRGDQNILVEKPFGGVNDDFTKIKDEKGKVRVGYVMRFNPIIQWVKKNVPVEKVVKVEGSYFSNTIEKKTRGWRNGKYSGVLNEMGSHIIDLAVYFFGLKEPKIYDKVVKSVVSDVDDVVSVELEKDKINYRFHFDWVNKAYRKPVFNLKFLLNDGKSYKVDQQKVEIFNNNNLEDRISTVDLAVNVPFYLRGVDFTNQMQDFIDKQNILATVDEALITRSLIKNILS